MKVYIDTNILVDLVCLREPFAEQAQKLFALGYIGKLSPLPVYTIEELWQQIME